MATVEYPNPAPKPGAPVPSALTPYVRKPVDLAEHQRIVRVMLAWIIALLAVLAIVALIVAYNVIELDVFIHNLENAISNNLPSNSGF
jgi:hypothetical protein